MWALVIITIALGRFQGPAHQRPIWIFPIS
jgi:hypothetical protein